MISIGLKDVIDIVLVALLLYYIYRLMKESSSANIILCDRIDGRLWQLDFG